MKGMNTADRDASVTFLQASGLVSGHLVKQRAAQLVRTCPLYDTGCLQACLKDFFLIRVLLLLLRLLLLLLLLLLGCVHPCSRWGPRGSGRMAFRI